MEIVKSAYAQGLGIGATPATLQDLEMVFINVVSMVLGLAGITLFVMLLLGGFSFLTAGADPAKAEAAKKTLTYAFYGFIAIAAGYLILRLIAEFTGASGILQFNIIYSP